MSGERVCGTQTVRHEVRRALRRSSIRNRMDRAGYTQSTALPKISHSAANCLASHMASAKLPERNVRNGSAPVPAVGRASAIAPRRRSLHLRRRPGRGSVSDSDRRFQPRRELSPVDCGGEPGRSVRASSGADEPRSWNSRSGTAFLDAAHLRRDGRHVVRGAGRTCGTAPSASPGWLRRPTRPPRS